MEWTESDIAFIRAQRVARMATVRRQDSPHVVPVCFAFDGESFFTALDRKPKRVSPDRLRRVQNLQEDPSVALILDEYNEDWSQLRYLLVRGEAVLVTDPGERRNAFRLLEEKYEQYRGVGLSEADWPLIRVAPMQVHRWQASEENPEEP
ncbi:MAG: TIGR03668 family PPOX class F420-dependent oxidoreductase [Thermoplasmata archaeon]